ncbi:MAG: 16S rRNA (cytidine(1402)-2'-O)-methyltransferase [bacterium]|nr:16S rRNA (cytidine(1402)-2'-O)-methyltransferase [bacterium]
MPLVLVPTPLGNLGDVTQRALATLRAAELVVAEDTRVARTLLHALHIGAKELWSYREQNAAAVTNGIIERARESLVAVVSDAGMPGISDPGTELVAAARAAGVAVEVLPGPSAALGVAVLSGFPLRRFCFEGFPPRTGSARRSAFERAFAHDATTIWYESPKRIRESLAALAALAPDARVFLVREYTKRFEQQVLGSPTQVAEALEEPIRGEIAFAVAPYRLEPETSAPEDLDTRIDALLKEGRSAKEIARALAAAGAGDRRALYARASARRSMGDEGASEQ